MEQGQPTRFGTQINDIKIILLAFIEHLRDKLGLLRKVKFKNSGVIAIGAVERSKQSIAPINPGTQVEQKNVLAQWFGQTADCCINIAHPSAIIDQNKLKIREIGL